MSTEPLIRLGSFFMVLAAMAFWERLRSRRVLTVSRAQRWTNNLGMMFVYLLLLRLVFPLLAIDMAVLSGERGWGLLNNTGIPFWAAFITGILVLDLAMYLQHVILHAIPVLWRLHMVHHADLDFDTTTGLRFHPVEVLLSMVFKMAVIVALGPPASAVLLFEVLLNASSMFNHGNVSMPPALDRALRLAVVTPDMHRVHHSVVIRETNSNFGFSFSWWDRLFGTYRAQPAAGHEGMTIGLSQFRESRRLTLPRLLVLPLTGEPGNYPLGRMGREPKAQE